MGSTIVDLRKNANLADLDIIRSRRILHLRASIKHCGRRGRPSRTSAFSIMFSVVKSACHPPIDVHFLTSLKSKASTKSKFHPIQTIYISSTPTDIALKFNFRSWISDMLRQHVKLNLTFETLMLVVGHLYQSVMPFRLCISNCIISLHDVKIIFQCLAFVSEEYQ